MTNYRYNKLKDITIDTINLDCPVEIDKGALLSDTETQSIILQLRFRNLIDAIITSIFIKIHCFDAAGDKIKDLELVEFAYLDLTLKNNADFGDKVPIILDSGVRNVEVVIDKITFQNGEVWRDKGDFIVLQTEQFLQVLRFEVAEQLNKDVSSKKYLGCKFRFVPTSLEEIWLCSCGRANRHDQVNCKRCGVDKNWIFINTTKASLDIRFTDYQVEKEREVEENFVKLQQQYKLAESTKLLQQQENEILQTQKKTKIMFFMIFLILVSSGVFVDFKFFKPTRTYAEAIKLAEKKQYEDAINRLATIENYKDSGSLRDRYILLLLEKGDRLIFGAYEQDGNRTNGDEPIEWRVLKVEDGTALLISDKVIDYVNFESPYKAKVWESSKERKWLNTVFMNSAFSSLEQSSIIESTVANSFGENTIDKVFLLNEGEVPKYLGLKEGRVAEITTYANIKGELHSTLSSHWMLRGPVSAHLNDDGHFVSVINGEIDNYSYTPFKEGYMRPVVSIKITQDILKMISAK